MKEEIDIALIHRMLLGEEIQNLPQNINRIGNSYSIENKIIKGNIFFKNGNGPSITFNDCIFEGSLNFRAEEFKSSITTSGCAFNSTISLTEGNYSNLIHIGGVVKKGIYISSGTYKRIEIDCDCESLNIGGCNIEGLFVQGTTNRKAEISQITFNGIGFIGSIFLTQITIGILDLNWFLGKDSEIFLKEIAVSKLLISNFINEGKLMIFNLSASKTSTDELVVKSDLPMVGIVDSYLGRAYLYNINFKKFANVIIQNSLLTECTFINIFWPDKILTSIDEDMKLKMTFSQKREAYKQIKFVLAKQGDSIGEQHFHELEMNAYYKTLRYKNESSTKIILWLSKITSNYGQNLWRPILTLMLINGLLFWLLYMAKGTIFDKYDLSKPQNYLTTLTEFIRLSNPLHKNEPESKGFAFLIDTSIRIVSSYCIYNVIRATRRFVK